MKTKERSRGTEDYVFSYDAASLEEENRLLKETIATLKAELARFQKAPLLVAEVKELLGEQALLRLTNGNEFLVELSPGCGRLRAGDSVLVEQKNLTIIKRIPTSKAFNVERFVIVERPDISWNEIGGLGPQITELREVVELPLLKPELFEEVGISPPKGVLLHGPPGTGKTMLAKAVAASTSSTFIEIVASELVQKFIGEGAKQVKEIFQLAREKAPSIIFIDELDALAARRLDIGTSGEREVQRTFMQLLAELDGFKALGNIKVIGCTNRVDILDPAILRPGRLDRIIEVPLPDDQGIEEIVRIHTAQMHLDRVDLRKLVPQLKGMSGAEIKAVVTEAGYFAIREGRIKVNEFDFFKAIKKVCKKEPTDWRRMFG